VDYLGFSGMKGQSRKYGGHGTAGRDAGAPRDPLAIYKAGQDALPGYRVEASAYNGVASDGKSITTIDINFNFVDFTPGLVQPS
jgi:hypothetical protein